MRRFNTQLLALFQGLGSILMPMLILQGLCLNVLHAQIVPADGQVPGNLRWQQIETDTVRVVFQEGMKDRADRLVSLVHHMAARNVASIGGKFRKADIFLMANSTESNGYVAMPPFHSKFFMRAPSVSFAGSTDWLDLLAIHEYRHVMQYANANHGLTKWLYYLFGEGAYTAAAHLAIPPWFWEGDAVAQETALSFSGRGRMPSFSASLRSIADLDAPFSYEKMVCGSYRDRIPDHYELGFALNAYGRKVYGEDFWPGVYREASAFKRVFWPFSGAIHKRTGLRTRGLYQRMIQNHRSVVTAPDSLCLFSAEFPDDEPGSYSSPCFVSEDRIIAQRYGFKTEAEMVSLDLNGNIEVLFPAGFTIDRYDAHGSGIIWNEITHHPRWESEGYSDLFFYEFNSGKTRRLTHSGRYFLPKISPEGKRILAVKSHPIQPEILVLIDLEGGGIMDSIPNPDRYSFGHSCWVNEYHIATVARKGNEQSIMFLDIRDKTAKFLLPFSTALIENLDHEGGKIYFLSNVGGSGNQLYVLELQNGSVRACNYQPVYAMEMPSVSPHGKIAFIDRSHNQDRLKVIQETLLFPNENNDVLSDRLHFENNDLPQILADQEGGPILDSIETIIFPARNYRAGFTKLRLHSWIFLPFHPNYVLSLQANDPLGQLALEVQPGFNLNERVFMTSASLVYAKYFIQMGMKFNTLTNRNVSNQLTGDIVQNLKWNEAVAGAYFRTPLQWIRHHYYFSFVPVLGYEHIMTEGEGKFQKGRFHSFYLEMAGAAIRRKSYRSIWPKYSARTSMAIQKVWGDNWTISSEASFYLPGLLPVHSAALKFRYRFQDKTNTYIFLDSYHYAGGYDPGITSDWITGGEVHYAFPIWYPDLAVGPFAFIKRLRSDIYYKTDLYGPDLTDGGRQIHTLGLDILVDARYLRLIDFPIGIGVDFRVDRGAFKFLGIHLALDNL